MDQYRISLDVKEQFVIKPLKVPSQILVLVWLYIPLELWP